MKALEQINGKWILKVCSQCGDAENIFYEYRDKNLCCECAKKAMPQAAHLFDNNNYKSDT